MTSNMVIQNGPNTWLIWRRNGLSLTMLLEVGPLMLVLS
jgi:hypothetical protein